MSVLTAITSALGIKEIWLIWKKRVELNNKKLTKDANLKDIGYSVSLSSDGTTIAIGSTANKGNGINQNYKLFWY